MKIKLKHIKDIAVLSIEGRIDINSSGLIEAVGRLLKKGSAKIVIDMKDINFIDYNGLSVLAITYKNALNNKCVMKLCGISLQIQELFRIVKLDDIFEIYNDLDEVLEVFTHKATVNKRKVFEQPWRRRFIRLDLDMPIVYRLTKGPRYKAGDNLYSGRMANLSGAGLFIRSIQLLPLGSKVLLEIVFEKGQDPKQFQGTVIWLADKGFQPELYPGMGVAFTGLSSYAQETVIEYIEKHAATSKN
jgi:anti-anti-sigma factor